MEARHDFFFIFSLLVHLLRRLKIYNIIDNSYKTMNDILTKYEATIVFPFKYLNREFWIACYLSYKSSETKKDIRKREKRSS